MAGAAGEANTGKWRWIHSSPSSLISAWPIAPARRGSSFRRTHSSAWPGVGGVVRDHLASRDWRWVTHVYYRIPLVNSVHGCVFKSRSRSLAELKAGGGEPETMPSSSS
jgi:hypothetical protein